MQEIKVSQEEISRVKEWMDKHCMGFRNARTRQEILPFLRMPDRAFRATASELIHEGHLCSSASRGYWAVPLVTKDIEEVEAVLDAQIERKSKALDLLADCDKAIKLWQDRKRCLTQQMELNLVGKEIA